jgi:hypothetical protein
MLEDAAQAGGIGFGEHSGRPRPTVYALARLGLVQIGSFTRSGYSREHAVITREGVLHLRSLGSFWAPVHRGWNPGEFYPLGFHAWETIPASKPGGASTKAPTLDSTPLAAPERVA